MLRPSEHLHGLNLINSTNMDYFQPAHQAEMISLKAQFLNLINDHDSGWFLASCAVLRSVSIARQQAQPPLAHAVLPSPCFCSSQHVQRGVDAVVYMP